MNYIATRMLAMRYKNTPDVTQNHQIFKRYLDCKNFIFITPGILLGLSRIVIKGYEFEIAHN